MKKETKKLLDVMFEDDCDVIGLGGGGSSSSGGGSGPSMSSVSECGVGVRNNDGTVSVTWRNAC